MSFPQVLWEWLGWDFHPVPGPICNPPELPPLARAHSPPAALAGRPGAATFAPPPGIQAGDAGLLIHTACS